MEKELVTESGDKKIITEITQVPVTTSYDLLHFVPPMSVHDFVRDSGLGANVEGNWVDVDIETMIHNKYKNIISLGDCANLPTSKTSAAVRIQVPIAVNNLIALMEGRTDFEKYNGYTACPIITEYGKVLLCEFGYDKNPLPSIPFADPAVEHWAGWFLKKYALKPMYFYGNDNRSSLIV